MKQRPQNEKEIATHTSKQSNQPDQVWWKETEAKFNAYEK